MNALTQEPFSAARMRWHVEPVVDHLDDPMDVTGWWLDQTPDSDAAVTVYVDHDYDHGQYNPSIKGFGFEEGGITLFYSPAEVSEWTDRGAIARLESDISERMNG